jgi:hypothetical protein
VHVAANVAAGHECAARRVAAATATAATATGVRSRRPTDTATTAAATATATAATARAHSRQAVGRAQELGERVGVPAVFDQGRKRPTASGLGLGGGFLHGRPPPPHARVNEPVVHLRRRFTKKKRLNEERRT